MMVVIFLVIVIALVLIDPRPPAARQVWRPRHVRPKPAAERGERRE